MFSAVKLALKCTCQMCTSCSCDLGCENKRFSGVIDSIKILSNSNLKN
jgi:hypothetical protein